MLSISDLKKKRHPKNPNAHPKDQIKRLAEILKGNGIRHPIVISNLSGFITKGHGRLEAAIENNYKEFPVEYQDYDSEDLEYADIVADNAIASWAELNLKMINAEIPELGPDLDIKLLGLKDFELEPADKYADKDADHVPDVKESFVKKGDLWILGNHRLLCGDATKKEDVERLMNGDKADMVYTDPPYGISLDGSYSSMPYRWNDASYKHKFKDIQGDSIDYDPSPCFQFKEAKEVFVWGLNNFISRVPIAEKGSWIVWDKKVNENLDKMISGDFELCWSKNRHKYAIARFKFSGIFGTESEDTKSRVHPSQKPVALHEWFFERWGKDKTNIVDLYLGSGSTLIACEKTNRKCFGMEIDAHYCGVIIERWQKFTGQKAYKAE